MQEVRETCRSMAMHPKHSLSKEGQRLLAASHHKILLVSPSLCSAVRLWLFLRTGNAAFGLVPSTGSTSKSYTFDVREARLFLDRPYEDFLGPVRFNPFQRARVPIFPDSLEKALWGGTWAFLLRHIMILRTDLPSQSHAFGTETKILADRRGKRPNSEAHLASRAP
jgi:hypothetical protein